MTVGGYTYRSSIASMGGRFLIRLAAAHRAPSGVAGGDEVEVELAIDDAPRTVEVPPELAAFDARSSSNQRRLAEPIGAADAAGTRARRVAEVLDELRG